MGCTNYLHNRQKSILSQQYSKNDRRMKELSYLDLGLFGVR